MTIQQMNNVLQFNITELNSMLRALRDTSYSIAHKRIGAHEVWNVSISYNGKLYENSSYELPEALKTLFIKIVNEHEK